MPLCTAASSHAAKLVIELDGRQHGWFAEYDVGRTHPGETHPGDSALYSPTASALALAGLGHA